MIGISGIARSGKDTLARSLKRILETEDNLEVEIISLANQLKEDLDDLIKKNFGFSAFSENTEEKNLIRPILVSYGESMKEKFGKTVWVEKLMEKRDPKKFTIVPDVRFDFEAIFFSEKLDAEIIHISLDGNEYVNEIEKINDPLVQELANIKHNWPVLHPDQIELCDMHASILWQMMPEYKKNIWKTI